MSENHRIIISLEAEDGFEAFVDELRDLLAQEVLLRYARKSQGGDGTWEEGPCVTRVEAKVSSPTEALATMERHVAAFHTSKQPKRGEDLSRWHARQHHRYATNHYHEGPNTGPDNRPPGWYTGEGAVPTSNWLR